jgi:hypothetical protein
MTFINPFYVPKAEAAKNPLAVPTPVVSVETTPVFDTKLVIDCDVVDIFPYPKMALSTP